MEVKSKQEHLEQMEQQFTTPPFYREEVRYGVPCVPDVPNTTSISYGTQYLRLLASYKQIIGRPTFPMENF